MLATIVGLLATCVLLAPTARSAPSHRCSQARAAIGFYVQATHRWQLRHDSPLTVAGNAARSPGCAYVRWAARRWQDRAHAARHVYGRWFTVTYAKWACIHSREGSWSDEGLPQMGGLQMDPDFQKTYGSEFLAVYGDAGHWPVWAQLLAAERAYHGYHGYRGRGFAPWPNTSRACGLR